MKNEKIINAFCFQYERKYTNFTYVVRLRTVTKKISFILSNNQTTCFILYYNRQVYCKKQDEQN